MPIWAGGHYHHLGASVGSAVSAAALGNLDDLLARADVEAYKEKRGLSEIKGHSSPCSVEQRSVRPRQVSVG